MFGLLSPEPLVVGITKSTQVRGGRRLYEIKVCPLDPSWTGARHRQRLLLLRHLGRDRKVHAGLPSRSDTGSSSATTWHSTVT